MVSSPGMLRSSRRQVDAVGEGGVPASGAGGAHGLAEGAGRADEHDELLGADDGGVEQVARHLAGAHRGQLVDVLDQQQVEHRGLIHHDHVRIQWPVPDAGLQVPGIPGIGGVGHRGWRRKQDFRLGGRDVVRNLPAVEAIAVISTSGPSPQDADVSLRNRRAVMLGTKKYSPPRTVTKRGRPLSRRGGRPCQVKFPTHGPAIERWSFYTSSKRGALID